MHVTVATLVAPGRPAGDGIDLMLLTSLLRAVATPDDGLEHIVVRSAPGLVQLVFFLALASATAAEQAGERICGRALDAARQLSGWTVSEVT